MKHILLLIAILLSFNFAEAKPFKRAMVISGGYLSPGAGLGMIAGAKAAGFEPEVIIFTCGASMAASLYSGYGSLERAMEFARSAEHFDLISNLLRIDTRFAPTILANLEQDAAKQGRIPQLFTGNILRLPAVLPEWLPNPRFRRSQSLPRYIVVAARAGFGPQDVGARFEWRAPFKQVYFTDSDTAQYLRGRKSDIKRTFPGSYIDSETEVMTNVSLSQAFRASISDPYYINPARIGDAYYFSGAVDLFPIDLAKDLADQVLVTAPSTDYAAHDVQAIYNAFGFNQQTAAIRASRRQDVTFIDQSYVASFKPKLVGPFLSRGLPRTAGEFTSTVDAQYLVAYYSAYLAAQRAMK